MKTKTIRQIPQGENAAGWYQLIVDGRVQATYGGRHEAHTEALRDGSSVENCDCGACTIRRNPPKAQESYAEIPSAWEPLMKSYRSTFKHRN